jgi:hypothetical protein
MDSTQSPHGPNVDCRKYSHGVPMESSQSPHGVHVDSVRTVRSPHGLHANWWASVKYSVIYILAEGILKMGVEQVRRWIIIILYVLCRR